jgi:hypothetical protein
LFPFATPGRSIDHGLVESRFGIVVLSKAFFAKDWPQYELDGLSARQRGETKVILPVWLDVDREFICQHSPPLADRLANNADKMPLEKIVAEFTHFLRSH